MNILQDLCNDKEGWGPASGSRVPDFTTCFEDGVVLALPNILFLVFGAYRLHKLLNRFPFPSEITHNWHYYAKITLVSLLLFVNVCFAGVVWSKSHVWMWDVSILSAGLIVLATLMALLLHRAEATHARLSSTTLLLYYLFVLIADGIKLRTLVKLGHSPLSLLVLLFSASIALTAALFSLENLRPFSPAQYTLLDTDLNESPEETANIFSRLTFSWMSPLMNRGISKFLTMDDLWNLKLEDQANVISERFESNWAKEMKKKNPSLLSAMIATFGGPFAFAALFKVLQDILQFTQPILLSMLMKWIASYLKDGNPRDAYRGYLIAAGMFFTALFQTAFLHQYFQLCFVTGMRVRAGLVTAIYKKSLILNAAARQGSTVGEIVNHMSVDAQRFMDLCTYFHIVWSGPFQISLALYLLYRTMGVAIFAGVGAMLLMIPVNAVLSKRMKIFQKSQMTNKDSRIKLMNEILNGIRVIKLYAWELPFLKKIAHIRNDLELETLKKIGFIGAIQSFTWAGTPFLVSLSTFAVFIALGTGVLTSEIVFVSLSLFNLLQFPLNVVPNVIFSTIEASVSLRRLESFLTAEQLDPTAVTHEPTPAGAHAELVAISNGNFRWLKETQIPNLEGINFSAHKAELIAIVGRVGVGKSSLMSAILGDMVKGHDSSVVLRGNVAYVPQQAWIMNATVRDNILFGHRFDRAFYDETIEKCCLGPDIAILPGGDLTEIGEKGINLSGGQKARISLARAVYARADIYLLDDPLSAVDAHVGRAIFNNVIGPTGMLRSKCRLFVTHGISYLPRTDSIIMLRDGKIHLRGSYNDLMQDRSELYNLIREFGREVQVAELDAAAAEDIEEVVQLDAIDIQDIGRFEEESKLSPSKLDEAVVSTVSNHRGESFSSNHTILRRASVATINGKKKKGHYEPGKTSIIQREESAVGTVKWEIYKSYIMSSSPTGVFFYLLFLIISQATVIISSLFLKYWSSQNERKDGEVVNLWFNLGIYAAIGLTGSFFTIVQTLILWIWCGINSARVLHNKMLKAVIRSPMSFFDTTPLGRILNRFSKDQYTIDEVLPRTFGGYLRTLINVFATLTVICFSTPMFIALIIPMALLYVWIQRCYLSTSRELKRLDSVSRSPIYAHFQESLAGVASIRAYAQQDRFVFENEDRLDENQKAYFASIASNRWLAVRLEFLGSIVIFGAAVFSVQAVLTPGSGMDAGLAGLSVSFALSVTQSLNWCVRQFCEIETNIVSVERVEEYAHLPSEAPEIIEDNRPSPVWPDRGVIEYRNFETRYRDGLELVLKGISFKVNPKEKIGIVGRTGAGKSSLTLTLFRIIEASKGTIFIDGIDISKIGLHDLRSRLTIIPQDPVLFAGTVRENLDPFNAHDDMEIWQVLMNAHLKDHVVKMDGKLNAIVLEGGENFSVGQRQLICLARALLRRTSVLVLDEATASIDVETDAMIQETIRREFANCTILTIAHRVNTVLDNDRILVLDNGRIAEFDTPGNFLANPDSLFYGLVKESGGESGSGKK